MIPTQIYYDPVRDTLHEHAYPFPGYLFTERYVIHRNSIWEWIFDTPTYDSEKPSIVYISLHNFEYIGLL